MRTIDLYIVRSFLLSMVLWLVSLMALRIMVDMFANMDEFAEHGKMAQVLTAIVRYYGVHSLEYFTQLGGVIIVLSAVFTVARMNHTNELTAMLASGMSLHRVVWPIIICSMLLGGLIMANQEFVVPQFAEELMRQADGSDDNASSAFGVGLVKDEHRVWFSRRFHHDTKRMVSPLVLFRTNDRVLLGAGYSRTWAVPVDATETSPSGWAMGDASLMRRDAVWNTNPTTEKIYTELGAKELLAIIRKQVEDSGKAWPEEFRFAVNVSGAREEVTGLHIGAARFEKLPPETPNGPPIWRLTDPRFSFYADLGEGEELLGVIEGPHADWVQAPKVVDRHWKLAEGAVLFCPSELKPNDLIMQQIRRKTEFMSSRQLSRVLASGWAENPDAVRLTKFVRVAEPINNLVKLLLALPFILSRERNIKASFGLCVLITATFFVFVYICRYMALPPFWAAFLPILLFGPIAIVMFDGVKT